MKFENTEVWGFEHALRGMRNPMESWDKSDFEVNSCDWCDGWLELNKCQKCVDVFHGSMYIVGKRDLKLAKKLIRAGGEHRKFMRQIFVSVDITAPIYWWKEFDTYKVGTVANSTSTMHKLANTPITADCFETDDYEDKLDYDGQILGDVMEKHIEFLEKMRLKYLETKDKRYWKELIRWLPESWLQKRTVTMNYENIYSMVRQRKNHKLNEWSGIDNPDTPNFMSWAKGLPLARNLIFIDMQDKESND